MIADPIKPYSPGHGRPNLPPRWHVDRTYRSEQGPIMVENDVEELSEVHHLVERGPDWNTLIEIRITLNRVSHPGLTVEATENLPGWLR
jgi:hypothetical protein